ncbi:MAG: amino acid ABC transporter permease [Bifidobacteriaceae bacterium]|jgi:polar amino acid transport system substrate-binding protein|nr:amino acid ABC transporter permease [Bifidobacteriaceae bacterium]
MIEIFIENRDSLLTGLLATLELAIVSCVLATALGIVLGVVASLRIKALNLAVTIFVDVVRGIPLLVLTFFIYYGISPALGVILPVFTAGVISLTINAGAYITEIVRGGIRAVSKGQKEAALAIGMTFNQSMRVVVLPQAFQIMLPNFVSQYIITLKDTTIISAIGLLELLLAGKKIVGRTFASLPVYSLIAIFFLIVISLLTWVAKTLEKRTEESLG